MKNGQSVTIGNIIIERLPLSGISFRLSPRNNPILTHLSYTYRIDKKCTNKTHFRCSTKKCSGRIFLEDDKYYFAKQHKRECVIARRSIVDDDNSEINSHFNIRTINNAVDHNNLVVTSSLDIPTPSNIVNNGSFIVNSHLNIPTPSNIVNYSNLDIPTTINNITGNNLSHSLDISATSNIINHGNLVHTSHLDVPSTNCINDANILHDSQSNIITNSNTDPDVNLTINPPLEIPTTTTIAQNDHPVHIFPLDVPTMGSLDISTKEDTLSKSGNLQSHAHRSVDYEFIRSSRGYSLIYSDKYLYAQNGKKLDTIYYRCRVAKCKGRGKLVNDAFLPSRTHNHPGDESGYYALKTRNALKDAAIAAPHKSASEIYHEVMKSVMSDPLAMMHHSSVPVLKNIGKLFTRCRGQMKPPGPKKNKNSNLTRIISSDGKDIFVGFDSTKSSIIILHDVSQQILIC